MQGALFYPWHKSGPLVIKAVLRGLTRKTKDEEQKEIQDQVCKLLSDGGKSKRSTCLHIYSKCTNVSAQMVCFLWMSYCLFDGLYKIGESKWFCVLRESYQK